MEDNFFLDKQILDQLRQPVLFAQGDVFVHGNQAAAAILQLESHQLDDHLSDDEMEAYRALEEGSQLVVNLEVSGQFCQTTISKSGAYASFILQDSPSELDISLDVLPSLAYAVRAPLTQIFEAMDELFPLLEDYENQVYNNLTAHANQAMYRLLRITANMFDYPMFIQSTRPLYIEKVNIKSYFDEHIKELESMAIACNMTLQTEVNFKNLVGYFDKQQIFRMILNLFSNAVSASHPGAIIRLQLTTKGKILQVRVEDKGAGIPPHVLASLFNQFDAGNLHEKRGSAAGFGLPLARQIALSHGGNLMLNSAPNQGTVAIATAKISQENTSLSTPAAQLDYTSGHNICTLEMSELLPVKDFYSSSL
ncbi:MAG: sensor histidine kinase [Eubacteriales bacterium]